MPHTNEHIVCPNCGFKTTHNYCAQCGQETHLHNDTFWGLVVHFIGHYFHYDSKFWQTIKTLWVSPGKLTLAYRDKQRMRYIPPISLYIFISAVFFLSTYMGGSEGLIQLAHKEKTSNTSKVKGDFVDISLNEPKLAEEPTPTVNYLEKKQQRIIEEHGSMGKFFIEKTNHNIPKIFFFMIPVMAAILKLLYRKRKDVAFIDHTIFAIHYHSFWFSIFIIGLIHFPTDFKLWIYLALFTTASAYMVMALHNVYKTSIARAILKTCTMVVLYTIILAIALIIDLFIIFAMA